MSTKRVLLIENETNLCVVIKACLEHIGHWQVLTSQSGQEGLLLAESEKPDGILLDWMLPDLDGLTVFDKLQINSVTQAIPVILLTGNHEIYKEIQYKQSNLAGIITKPFDPLKLAEQVTNLVGW